MIPKKPAVAERAHELWVEAGRPDGRSEVFWYKAEEEIESREYGNDHPQPVSPLPKTRSGSKPVRHG